MKHARFLNQLLTAVLGLCLALLAACSSPTGVEHQAAIPGHAPEDVVGKAKPQPVEEEKTGSPAVVSSPAPVARLKREALSSGAYLSQQLTEADHYGRHPQPHVVDRENYAHIDSSPVRRVAEHPVSTFSIDVDSGSYANVRRMLTQGRLPPADAVRVEEMINYFSYQYPQPENRDRPFRVSTEIAPTPWNADTHLLHIGIKGYEVPRKNLPPANLVFLVDVSGSMQAPNKLELLKSSLKLLTRQLGARDRISLVVYAGASGLVLEPTPANQQAKINAALDRLRAGGSTNGGAGIELAYAMAQQGFIRAGINRVILATDGDFNVGAVNHEALINLIEQKRKTGVSLTTLGFGMGNYNDRLMEQLANQGNGNYAYIDTLNESNKVLVNELSSTLFTIAKDVKIQLEFNPAVVSEYRLIGYENRTLRREDFKNDNIDAGEIGAGHTVTALYEITLAEKPSRIEPLRYGQPMQTEGPRAGELAHLRMRYKAPDGDTSKLIEWPLQRSDIVASIDRASDNLRFSASVAAFAELLRGGKQSGKFTFKDVIELSRKSRGDDPFGYRGEFIKLVDLAQSLSAPRSGR